MERSGKARAVRGGGTKAALGLLSVTSATRCVQLGTGRRLRGLDYVGVEVHVGQRVADQTKSVQGFSRPRRQQE